MTKVAINGLGRIGRATFKAILENSDLELVAVNDLVDASQMAYLLNFDSVYGKLESKVDHDGMNLYTRGRAIRVFNSQDPSQLPWKEMNIDLVFECTGKFTVRQDLEKHLQAGAKRVILSAPSSSDDIPTVVHGVNQSNEEIISCASCTTNSITPIMEIIGRRIGIRKAAMTTLHAYTASQSIVDEPAKDRRRGRAAGMNLIPTSTGAAKATSKVLPEFTNRFDGSAIRGPVPVGSIADITIITERPTSVEELNAIFGDEAGGERYRGIVGVNVEPIVSSDIIKDPRASVVDLCMTQVIDGDLVKIMSWYDNEWGYANQMVREAKRLSHVQVPQRQEQAWQ